MPVLFKIAEDGKNILVIKTLFSKSIKEREFDEKSIKILSKIK